MFFDYEAREKREKLSKVIDEIKDVISEDKVVVSIAAGQSLEKLNK